MNFVLETVAIKHPDNPGESMVINKSDYDPEKHKLWEPEKVEAGTGDEGGESDSKSETGSGSDSDAEPKPGQGPGRRKNPQTTQ